jgi:putative toxin-antitoxin system antitoxin component (TIGR02293 family)
MSAKNCRLNPEVYARCIEVFGDEAKALRWLETPNFALGKQRPFELLGSEEGIQLVLDTLGRIEYGVFA